MLDPVFALHLGCKDPIFFLEKISIACALRFVLFYLSLKIICFLTLFVLRKIEIYICVDSWFLCNAYFVKGMFVFKSMRLH